MSIYEISKKLVEIQFLPADTQQLKIFYTKLV